MRARETQPAAGRRLHARVLARRAATVASRGRRGRSAGRREAVAGRALSCVVRNCEYDARRCARRASRGRTGCLWSCSWPWRRSRVTRAAVVEGAGAGVARLWSWVVAASSVVSGWCRVGGWDMVRQIKTLLLMEVGPDQKNKSKIEILFLIILVFGQPCLANFCEFCEVLEERGTKFELTFEIGF